MRRDDEARQLLVGIVGQREDDPGRLRAGLERAHLDAPHDAVGAGRGRDLDPVALGAVVLDRPGEVDRVGIGRNPDRLDRERRAAAPARTSASSRTRRNEARRAAPALRAASGRRATARKGSARRRANRSRTNQDAVRRVRGVALEQREKNMVAPRAVDLEIAARIALALEAVALEERDRGRVVGDAGRLDAVQPQFARRRNRRSAATARVMRPLPA